jgi:inhibitor of KinA sporulation pathway (predicted exonuclease)
MQAEYYPIVDFEATCCNKGTIPSQEMEIIEIGAVMVDASTFQVIDECQTFVRPVRHPKLTLFCTALTSIQQKDVSGAPAFKEAIAQFKTWLYRYSSFLFCSWGDYDRKQLQQDCQFHNVPYPINAPHINLKRLIAKCQDLPKKPGLAQAVQLAGLEFVGTHHRGIDDARNIARLLVYAFGDKRF